MLLSYKRVGVITDKDSYPFNPRGQPGDTTDLQAGIKRDGQRTPMTVTQPNEDGVHILTRGHRRKAAIDALRAQARKLVREYAQELSELAGEQEEHADLIAEITALWTAAKEDVKKYSSYHVMVSDIQPDDVTAILHDMDTGVIEKKVDPVALGETMIYRIGKLNWTFQQCCESLEMKESYAYAAMRAADPNKTAESVRRLLRTGEMSLSMFIKKISKLDILTQQKVVEASQTRADSSKRGHGVVNAGIINAVMTDMLEPPTAPDSDVLPLLGTARENIYLALNIKEQWSPATWEAASWQLEEIVLTIANQLKEIRAHA